MKTRIIMKKSPLLLALTASLMLVAMILSTADSARASDDVDLYPTISVDPLTYTAVALGETISVNVNIAGANNLRGLEFKLVYNTTLLDCLEVVEGPFLKGFGKTLPIKLETDETLGLVWVIDVLLDLTTAEGNGVLVAVNFECTAEGKCLFALFDTKIVSGGVKIDHLVTDSYSTSKLVDPPAQSSHAEMASTTTLETKIFAGGSHPGVVYEYLGGNQWQTVSQELGYAVLCLCEYDGHLYAGTRSDIGGGLWRYDGDATWTQVGTMDDQICSLIVFRGKLHAGTAWRGGKLYRYEGDNTWTNVVICPSWSGFRSLYVWNDILYIGDIGYDKFGHYDGATFVYDTDLGGSCVWDYEVYGGDMYASAYSGRIHRSSDGVSWSTIRDYQFQNSWELEAFQDYLYVTTGPKLERCDGNFFSAVWTEPNGNEIISMINAGDRLVLGTGTEAGYGGSFGEGRIYTYDGAQVQLISSSMGMGIQALVLTETLPPPSKHDVAVTGVVSSQTSVEQGESLSINVAVENQGNFAETFAVTVYHGNPFITPEQWNTFWSMGDVNRDGYINWVDINIIVDNFFWEGPPGGNPADISSDGVVDMADISICIDHFGLDIWTYFSIAGGIIATQTVNGLLPESSAMLVFTWNTMDFALRDYTIGALAATVPQEIDSADNNFVDGVVSVVTTLSGVVADEYTKEPIQGVTISICETDEYTVTDEYGRYSFMISSVGDYTVEMTVPYSYMTHDVVTKFIEVSQATEVDFTLYQGAWSGETVPRTIGYWKNWDSHCTREVMETYVSHVKAASGLFNDLTVDSLKSHFNMVAFSMKEKGEAQLLASWLNVVSAQLGVDVQVDLSSISGWDQVITIPEGSVLTVNELFEKIDNLYLTDAGLTKQQWEIVKNILDALNNGQLFLEQ